MKIARDDSEHLENEIGCLTRSGANKWVSQQKRAQLCGASERVIGASEWVSERASGPISSDFDDLSPSFFSQLPRISKRMCLIQLAFDHFGVAASASYSMRIYIPHDGNAKKSNRHKIRAEYGKDIFAMNVFVFRPSILGSKKATN